MLELITLGCIITPVLTKYLQMYQELNKLLILSHTESHQFGKVHIGCATRL